MNKNSDFVYNFFLRGGGCTLPPTEIFFKLLELSQTSRTRKLIFRLQVNIDKLDKANSGTYDVTW